MPVADVELPSELYLTRVARPKIIAGVLFTLLIAFTLCTLDGGDVAPLMLSAATLLFCAYALLVLPFGALEMKLPCLALLAMAAYGVAQTLWFPRQIVYDGWTGVL